MIISSKTYTPQGKIMNTQESRIDVKRTEDGGVRVVFGPHHFTEIRPKEGGGVEAFFGTTHHGFRADASVVNSQLEDILDEVKERHPELSF